LSCIYIVLKMTSDAVSVLARDRDSFRLADMRAKFLPGHISNKNNIYIVA
jgi:hypothetical protein